MKKLAVIFALLLVVVWFSRIHGTVPAVLPASSNNALAEASATNTPLQGTESQMTESFEDLPSLPSPTQRSPSFAIDNANQDIIRSCLGGGRIHYGRGLTLENILDDLTTKIEPLEVTMNIHVRRSGGHEQRLHVEPAVDSPTISRFNVEGSSVRVYDVDKEGLPIAIAYPKALRSDSLNGVISGFTDSAEVTFRERRSHERLSDTAVADIVETNGHINQLQLFADDATLGCAWQNSQLDCRCL